MAKNKNKSNNSISSNVSNNGINIQKIRGNTTNVNSSITSCKEFSENVINNSDLDSMNIDDLLEMYDSGEQMLTSFYQLTPNTKSTSTRNVIAQTQYALSTLIYHINKKTNDELNMQLDLQKQLVDEQNKQIKDLISINDNLSREQKDLSEKNKELNTQMQSILVTIISIVASISIVSAAVTGIQDMESLFILPFVSTITLVGVIFIAFAMTIHNVKISSESKNILKILIAIVLIIWIVSWAISVNLKTKDLKINNKICIYNEEGAVKKVQ